MSLILPGDSSIQWTSFEETVDRKIVIIQENNIRKQVGFTTEQVIEEIHESKKMLRRTQTLKSDLIGDIEAISIISKDTFKPYKHKIITEDSTKVVEYFDSNVRLIHSNKERNIKTETKLFENHSVEMVIRLLPLHQGFLSNLVAFHPGKEKIINVAIRVVSKEIVKKCGVEMVESWKVEVDFEGNIQNYWISVNEKELLKQENVLSPDAKMIFERV
ncbi:hypothetical protein SAMN05421676_11619 [Salinibacillus kushneri]|uniref:Uncharacterized protein n=1 Tax=Salinibacillus kushneri TaxID=237682 RepID=A0A1I0J5C0_9BACI|nr:hypothetical protein [Salinibacillus kushneri]SEU05004.1 hypothetical protein SAMN05421676_11619 [Salinibacillus kushneri]